MIDRILAFKIFSEKKTPEINLRPLTADDFPQLSKWLAAPHVKQWWKDPSDLKSVTAQYSLCLDDKAVNPVQVYIIEVQGESIGMAQCYRHSDHPNWNRIIGLEKAAGIDIFIGCANKTGRGIGTKAMKQIVEIAFSLYPEVDVIVGAPQKNNKISCRVLENTGFVRTEERWLELDHPSNLGISYIYVLKRVDNNS